MKIGISYDNFSGNTGDNAIGISIKSILKKCGKSLFDELTIHSITSEYETVIIGGGLLIRENLLDLPYNRYRLRGRHILNSIGILGEPRDLSYLNEYKYVSVRSQGDRKKIEYIKNVSVVPCTTMLLEDIPGFGSKQTKPSIGVHVFPDILSEMEINQFIAWSKAKILSGYDLYLLPITLYRGDFEMYKNLKARIGKGCTLLPNLQPLEIFTFIGKLTYLITYSLHGAIFAYIHNVKFYLANVEEKMEFFMIERGLTSLLFNNINEMINLFEQSSSHDFTSLIQKDMEVLREHVYTIKSLL